MKMNLFSILSKRSTAILLGCMFLGSISAQKIIYVDQWATPGGDGTTWAAAYDDLETALQTTASGDEVWVAGGGLSQDGTTIVSLKYETPQGKPFTWNSGVNIYGGFAPGATTKEERDLNANPCELVANGARILFPGNFSKDTYLDGFILSGGNCDDAKNKINGIAAYIRSGAHIVNCIITGNMTTGNGAIALDGRDDNFIPTVENCTIYGNSVAGLGGGVHLVYKGIVKNCLIYNNKTTGSSGGGVAVSGSSLPAKVINCVIANNEAANNGGGIWGCGAEVINCTVVNNKALHTGNGDGNGNGGGILLDATPDASLSGAGIPSKIVNSVVWGNATIKNIAGRKDIWYGKADLSKGDISYSAIEDITTANSVIEQVKPDSHCVNLSSTNSDAKFVAPTAASGIWGDYSNVNWNISEGSALINKGNNDANSEAKDFAGNARVAGGQIDLGAYELSNGSSIFDTTSDEAVSMCFVAQNLLIVKGVPADVEIYTISGVLVKSALQTNTVNVSDLNAGIYLVKVKSEGNNYAQKVSIR